MICPDNCEPPMHSGLPVSLRRVWIVLLIAAVLGLWIFAARAGDPSIATRLKAGLRSMLSVRQNAAFAMIIALALIPALRRQALPILNTLRHPSIRTRRWLTLAVAGLSIVYLLLTALHQHRDLFPKWHDEFMYLLQARFLAHGRLWMPGHPLHDFFETFYVFTTPKYAPISFPGAALLFAPGIWLALPKWVIPLLISGACVGLLYRIVAELSDGLVALLSAFFLLGIRMFRFQALLAMANIPLLFFALVMVYGWLKWRREHRLGFAALIGVAMGWAVITRPADAMAASLPVAIAILFDLRRLAARQGLLTAAVVLACAAPFVCLQLIFNVGVSGKISQLPYTLYNKQDWPHMAIGVPVFDPAVKPQSHLAQKQQMYDEWLVPFILQHQPDNWLRVWINKRIPEWLLTSVPNDLFLLFVPVGLLGLTDRRRWVLFGVLPGALLIYGLLTVFIAHYSCLGFAAVTLLVMLGLRQVERVFPGEIVGSAMPALIAVAVLFGLPEISPWIRDDRGHDMPIVAKSQRLSELVRAPAIVLYKFTPGQNVHEEPVYNLDVLWPDDAPIIRAQDLGDERNQQLYRYYAERQPNRMIYRLDRADPTLALVRLGRADELSKAHPAPIATQPSP